MSDKIQTKEEIQHEEKSLIEKNDFRKKLDGIYRHIRNVEDAIMLLVDRLIDEGEFDLAKRLVIRGRKHDLSKFIGIEWRALTNDDQGENELFQIAIEQHWSNNDHHPEYWTGISDMSIEAIAEMCCDLKARSTEFGTDLREYVKEQFLSRHEITTSSKVYKVMKRFIDLLLDGAFKKVKHNGK